MPEVASIRSCPLQIWGLHGCPGLPPGRGLQWGLVFISWGCQSRLAQTVGGGSRKNTALFSHSSSDRKSEIRVWAGLLPPGSPGGQFWVPLAQLLAAPGFPWPPWLAAASPRSLPLSSGLLPVSLWASNPLFFSLWMEGHPKSTAVSSQGHYLNHICQELFPRSN